MKKSLGMILVLLCVFAMAGCGKSSGAEVTVFAAKSLNGAMDEIIRMYEKEHPGVTVTANYDSSGTLTTQIKEGADCDLFFSASAVQMDELEDGFEGGSVARETRTDLLHNEVCLVTWKGSGTKVTSLSDIGKAKTMALADESVPVGAYTRNALKKAGLMALLDGMEVNSCANVGAVCVAVSEGADEIGTVYYSDTFGYEEKLEILERIPRELTGDVIYPVACLKKDDQDVSSEAVNFIQYLQSEEAKAVFEKYHFIAE